VDASFFSKQGNVILTGGVKAFKIRYYVVLKFEVAKFQ
jgi:hypothetical protein